MAENLILTKDDGYSLLSKPDQVWSPHSVIKRPQSLSSREQNGGPCAKLMTANFQKAPKLKTLGHAESNYKKPGKRGGNTALSQRWKWKKKKMRAQYVLNQRK
jgi:hypothetical protein